MTYAKIISAIMAHRKNIFRPILNNWRRNENQLLGYSLSAKSDPDKTHAQHESTLQLNLPPANICTVSCGSRSHTQQLFQTKRIQIYGVYYDRDCIRQQIFVEPHFCVDHSHRWSQASNPIISCPMHNTKSISHARTHAHYVTYSK